MTARNLHGLGWMFAAALTVGAVGSANAKPLLDSSEESYASVCLDYDDTPQRLVEICTLALARSGATTTQRVDMLESLGYAYYHQNQLEPAAEVFDQILTLRPSEPKALIGHGWLAYEQEDFAKAKEWFEKALEQTASAKALAGLSDSLWQLGEIDLEDAMRYLDGALAIDPDYSWAKRQKGWILIDARRFEDARVLFSTILDETPYDENARAGLVRSLVRSGSYEEALAQTNRVLQESPDAFWFLSQRSNVLFILGRYRQAIRDADRLIELEPSDPEGYVRRARAMVYLGQTQDALSLLSNAEATIGWHQFLTYWHAKLLFDDDQLDQALSNIHRNTETSSVDVFDLKLLSRIQMARNEYDAAQRAIDRAKELRENDAYTLYYDAILMLRRNVGVDAALLRFDDAMRAGLPKDEIGEFAGELYQAGFLLQAIAIRAKYPD